MSGATCKGATNSTYERLPCWRPIVIEKLGVNIRQDHFSFRLKKKHRTRASIVACGRKKQVKLYSQSEFSLDRLLCDSTLIHSTDQQGCNW